MCGIIGAIGPESHKFIVQNLDLLKHRGPDSQGTILLDNNLTLAATRLAMTDPHPRSNQPMIDNVSSNALVFNGEIYNFKFLKKNLISKGVNFRTESDTELILKALTEFKNEYVKYFEGMFAFGFYNKSNNSLTLARDYLGKKPLYYSIGKNYLVFSSKISIVKKYLIHTGLDNKSVSLDIKSVSAYLKLGYVINPNTMFEEIKSVQPGELIEIDLTSLAIIDQIKFVPDSIINPPEIEIREMLKNALYERVIGHDSFALSMSGGIDSTIIAILASELNLNCNAYSMRWPESDKSRYNLDATNAKLIARKLGIPFQIVDMPKVNYIPELLYKFIQAMEEPNSNPSGLSMIALYGQITSDNHRLVLTGDGSDEIFAGYSRYKKMNKFHWIPKIFKNYLLSLGVELESHNQLLSKLAIISTPATNLNYWYHWQQIANDNFVKRFFRDYQDNEIPLEKNEFTQILTQSKSKLPISMYRDLKIWLSMESNNKLDKVSMAFSIEARSPFQSEKLIGVANREMVRREYKIFDKKLLTNQFSELKQLPTNETKMGFVSPLGHWLRNNPSMVLDNINYLKKHFDFNIVILDELIASPNKGNYSNFNFLWSLIVLANWHAAEFD